MIGLFLGDTDFSEIVLKKIKKLNKKYFIIDFSKNNKFKKDKNSHRISIGKFGEIISLIKQNKSKKVLFAGKIAKPKFSTLRLDLKGIYYMPSVIKASKSGDAAIIKSIIKILENENIKVISSNFFNQELSLKTGNYTKLKATMEDIKSIKKGILYFNQLNNLDHIQALIVKDNKIIATEGNQGTKKMLSKLKKAYGSILIKLPKKKQDLRMDLPTIGLNTLKDCKKYGLKGVVLKSKKNIFLDKTQCINFANKNKIFIKVL
jgi:UDP-2,3-diacylglucosamine hydrolase